MTLRHNLLFPAALIPCLLLPACGNEPSAQHDHQHAASAPSAGPVVWPPDEAMVFATTQVAIGDGSVTPAGRYALVLGPVPAAGTKLTTGETTMFLEPGASTGSVTLPAGEEVEATFVELDDKDQVLADGLRARRKLFVKKDPAEVGVQWLEPGDGDRVTSPFRARFKALGYATKAAGDTFDLTSGHHHILVNSGPTRPGHVLPMDEANLHYGKGQEEAELELQPGTHTLTLQFADGAHRSFGEPMSKTITITVEQ